MWGFYKKSPIILHKMGEKFMKELQNDSLSQYEKEQLKDLHLPKALQSSGDYLRGVQGKGNGNCQRIS